MANKVKSGKEVLEDFFSNIESIKGVDKSMAKALSDLYEQGKLTDRNVVNALQQLRDSNGNKN